MSDENPRKILDQLYALTGTNQPTTPEGKHERMLEVYRRLNALKRGVLVMENALVAQGSSFESAMRAADRTDAKLQAVVDQSPRDEPPEGSTPRTEPPGPFSQIMLDIAYRYGDPGPIAPTRR